MQKEKYLTGLDQIMKKKRTAKATVMQPKYKTQVVPDKKKYKRKRRSRIDIIGSNGSTGDHYDTE